jgi:hypothetical protein
MCLEVVCSGELLPALGTLEGLGPQVNTLVPRAIRESREDFATAWVSAGELLALVPRLQACTLAPPTEQQGIRHIARGTLEELLCEFMVSPEEEVLVYVYVQVPVPSTQPETHRPTDKLLSASAPKIPSI